jgi:hypothetical protein
MDCKATVNLGEFSRGGLTRGEVKACDHDWGCPAKYIPCGVVDEETGQLSISFGSSAKTSDFIVDVLEARWQALPAHEQRATTQLQLKMDNGPESSGVRTQFLHRLVQFAAQIGKPIHLLYYPPYHDTMLAWTQSMTWKGRSPVVELTHKEYARGMTLSKKAMRAVEQRLERHPQLPKWDILIRPAAPD